MLDDIRTQRQQRHVEKLEQKNSELVQKCATLEHEKKMLQDEVARLRNNEEKIRITLEEFEGAIKDARDAKGRYEKACDEMRILRKSYEVEVKRLIGDIKK